MDPEYTINNGDVKGIQMILKADRAIGQVKRGPTMVVDSARHPTCDISTPREGMP